MTTAERVDELVADVIRGRYTVDRRGRRNYTLRPVYQWRPENAEPYLRRRILELLEEEARNAN